MRIWIDRERLAAFNLTVQDVETALRAQNVELPSGRIESTRPRVHRAVAHRPRRRRSSSATSSSRSPTTTRSSWARWRASSSAPPTSGATAATTASPRSPSASSSRRPPIRSTSPTPCARCCRRSTSRCRRACSAEHRQRQRRVHRPLDQGGLPHHRRGDRAGRAGDLLLPALAARLADPDRHHPDLADRHLHADVRAWASPSTR